MTGHRRRSGVGLLAAALVLALVLPAAAHAARKPGVRTGPAANVAQSTATVTGTVRPNGAATTYFFEYGTTRLYGGRTPAGTVAAGAGPTQVAATIGGLAPATRYHYHLVAQNAKGVSKGKDRRLHTKRQPLGVSLAASPNPVRTGSDAVLAGVLSGTGNAGRQVVLQANPWPYTQGFVTVANPHVTGANGEFSFPVLAVPVNTQFRVLMPSRGDVVSPIVVVGTKVRVTTHLKVDKGRHRGTVRIKGSLIPAVDGIEVIIQKNRGGKWRNIEHTTARHHSDSRSHYREKMRQRRPGTYRVYAVGQGPHVPNVGRSIRVRHVHR